MMSAKSVVVASKHKTFVSDMYKWQRKSGRIQVDHIDDIGTVAYIPAESDKDHQRGITHELREKARGLGCAHIFHVDHREAERTLYVCLEDI